METLKSLAVFGITIWIVYRVFTIAKRVKEGK